jgi:hypothetical protein
MTAESVRRLRFRGRRQFRLSHLFLSVMACAVLLWLCQLLEIRIDFKRTAGVGSRLIVGWGNEGRILWDTFPRGLSRIPWYRKLQIRVDLSKPSRAVQPIFSRGVIETKPETIPDIEFVPNAPTQSSRRFGTGSVEPRIS